MVLDAWRVRLASVNQNGPGTTGGYRAMVKVAGVTERELDILSTLWREGSGTVAEVQDELHDPPGYTSVLKMLQILERKAWSATSVKDAPTGTSRRWRQKSPALRRSARS